MITLALSLLLSAPQLSYNEEIKGHNTLTEWFTEEKEEGITLQGISSRTNFTLNCDSNYIMNQVTYLSKLEDAHEQYSCKRDGSTLYVKRLSNDKEVVKEYNIGKTAWIQEFNFGLRPFIKSGLSSYRFCIINPADLSLNKMVAKKQHIELLSVNNETYHAQKVKITLQGPRALFWTAYAWFDTATGSMIKYTGNKGPKTPTSTVTLNN
ncbi:MAG: hypothetical protein ChlgKO_12410 [Chlamydiales bacterium]